jgi:hypothetical protein
MTILWLWRLARCSACNIYSAQRQRPSGPLRSAECDEDFRACESNSIARSIVEANGSRRGTGLSSARDMVHQTSS